MNPTPIRRHEDPGAVEELRHLEGEELQSRIRAGWDEWCDLLDEMIGSGGMLPPRELVRRAREFFEDSYWRAEEARVEALRRDLELQARSRRRGLDRSWGLG
jgi:hypothetical protein